MCRFFFLLFIYCSTFLSAADIAVVTIAAGDAYKESVKIGTESKRLYCQKHGYDFIYSEESQDPHLHIYWSKILLMLKTLDNPSYEWAVWMDADTLVMNTDIPLEDLIDEKYHLIISKDWNGINSGLFFLKNNDWSRELLTSIYARTECKNNPCPEQTALSLEIEKSGFKELSKVVPQRLFNSYPPETHDSSLITCYQPGDFLIHLAGVRNSGPLISLFKKYSQQVVHDRKLITLDQFLGIYGFKLSPSHSSNNEGYITEEQKQKFAEQLALHPHIETILEVGLNGGHSAECFFQNCKSLKKFVSFDINSHPYVPAAVEYLSRNYKKIFEFIQGDSTVTIPKYAKQFPNQKFDLIYIDGGHSCQQCTADLLNCKELAHEDTIVWLDDLNAINIQTAAGDLIEKGILRVADVQETHGKHGYRCWAELRYIFPPKE